MNTVLLANILMLVGEGILFYASSRKNKRDILLSQIVCQLFMIAVCYLLKGYSSIVMSVLSIIRNILSIKNIGSRYISYIFIALAIIFGVMFNNNGLWGLIPIVANVTQSAFILRRSSTARQIRLACAFTSFLWIIYNIEIKAYTGAATNLINGASYLYHGIKDKPKEKTGS